MKKAPTRLVTSDERRRVSGKHTHDAFSARFDGFILFLCRRKLSSRVIEFPSRLTLWFLGEDVKKKAKETNPSRKLRSSEKFPSLFTVRENPHVDIVCS
jgi:hypothetical protein